MEISANISGVVYRGCRSRSFLSLAACSRMKDVLATRRKGSTSKPGMATGAAFGASSAAATPATDAERGAHGRFLRLPRRANRIGASATGARGEANARYAMKATAARSITAEHASHPAEVAAEKRADQRADSQARDEAANAAHEAGFAGGALPGVRRGPPARVSRGVVAGRRGRRFLHGRGGALLAEAAAASEAPGGIGVTGGEAQCERGNGEQNGNLHGAFPGGCAGRTAVSSNRGCPNECGKEQSIAGPGRSGAGIVLVDPDPGHLDEVVGRWKTVTPFLAAHGIICRCSGMV